LDAPVTSATLPLSLLMTVFLSGGLRANCPVQ